MSDQQKCIDCGGLVTRGGATGRCPRCYMRMRRGAAPCARPTSITCAGCGSTVAVGPRGTPPKVCAGCLKLRKAARNANDTRRNSPEQYELYAIKGIPLADRLYEDQ